jgi:hypothetical protein
MKDFTALYRQFQVKDVNSIEEFITRYYKNTEDEFNNYARLKAHSDFLSDHGFTILPGSQSITGTVVAYFLKEELEWPTNNLIYLEK